MSKKRPVAKRYQQWRCLKNKVRMLCISSPKHKPADCQYSVVYRVGGGNFWLGRGSRKKSCWAANPCMESLPFWSVPTMWPVQTLWPVEMVWPVQTVWVKKWWGHVPPSPTKLRPWLQVLWKRNVHSRTIEEWLGWNHSIDTPVYDILKILLPCPTSSLWPNATSIEDVWKIKWECCVLVIL